MKKVCIFLLALALLCGCQTATYNRAARIFEDAASLTRWRTVPKSTSLGNYHRASKIGFAISAAVAAIGAAKDIKGLAEKLDLGGGSNSTHEPEEEGF